MFSPFSGRKTRTKSPGEFRSHRDCIPVCRRQRRRPIRRFVERHRGGPRGRRPDAQELLRRSARTGRSRRPERVATSVHRRCRAVRQPEPAAEAGPHARCAGAQSEGLRAFGGGRSEGPGLGRVACRRFHRKLHHATQRLLVRPLRFPGRTRDRRGQRELPARGVSRRGSARFPSRRRVPAPVRPGWQRGP